MIFFDSVYIVERYSAGHADPANGNKWVEGTKTDLPISMNIQPLIGNALQSLPEGRREKENIKGYSSEPLNVVDESAGKSPDIIQRGTDRFEVYECKPYGTLIPHYRFLASKK